MVKRFQFYKHNNKLTTLIVAVGAVLLVLVAWAWWHYVRSNPERTFYAAVSNSLQSRSFSKQITQDNGGQTLTQNLEVTLAPEHVIHGQTSISETGSTDTTVQTESISTPTHDYVRYSEINTNQKDDSGKVLDFSGLVDIWGKTETIDSSQTTGELYGETVLGIVPFGSLPAKQRTKLMDYVQNHGVYKFNPADTERQIIDGRPVYTYNVEVSAEAWVGMLKRFASAVGLTQLDQIDPASYRGSSPIKLTATVDVWSRQFTKLAYPESGREERLGSYGLYHEADIPKKTIPVGELQQRLQSVQ